MKETIGKSKVYHKSFLKSLRTNKTSITDKNAVAAKSQDFF